MEPITDESHESESHKHPEALCENREKGELEIGKTSFTFGIVFSAMLLFLGFAIAIPFTEYFLLRLVSGVLLSLSLGISGFFTISPGNGGVRILLGELRGVMAAGPYWEFWPLYSHVEVRISEFEVKHSTDSKMLSKDNIKVGISITARAIVTDLKEYYIHVVTSDNNSQNPEQKQNPGTIKELISAYLRLYANTFSARHLPEHRRIISVWIEGDEAGLDNAIEEHNRAQSGKAEDEKDVFPENFKDQYNLPTILKKWGFDFSTVVVEGIELPEEMVQETEQKDARMTEVEGFIDRVAKLRKDLKISRKDAIALVKEQEGLVHTIKIESPNAGDFTQGAAVSKTENTRGFGKRK